MGCHDLVGESNQMSATNDFADLRACSRMFSSIAQVQYFLAVAREKQFTRAAQSCGVKQPTLSAAIKELEAALGGMLFKRGGGGAQLTAFGRVVRPHMAAIARAALKADLAARAFHAAHMQDEPAGRAGLPAYPEVTKYSEVRRSPAALNDPRSGSFVQSRPILRR